jgi:23S rRNA (guanine1835-N2)-methyltransferase
MSADQCDTPFGTLVLDRLPIDRTGTLRAWDGADLLLLDFVSGLGLTREARIAVFGDNFGALSIALEQFETWMVADSIVAERAIRANRDRNGLNRSARRVSCAISGPALAAALGGPVDVVVWNVERENAVLAHIASLVSSISHPATVVIAAGMDKNLPPKTADVLRQLGDVTTHPGRRKAHLFELRPRAGATTFNPFSPPSLPTVDVPEYDLQLTSGPGVFSADRFDLGTRLLADEVAALPEILPDALEIVDLGCGSGALGMLALRALPEANVHFIDESAHAVATSERNVRLNAATLGPNALERSRFVQSDVFVNTDLPEIDLVLCNPPFHHANAMNDEVAWQMFQQSQRVLRPGGELWVVANRHLGYHDKLARIFEATAQVASHPKFVVIAGRR